METITGIFPSRSGAELACVNLRSNGFTEDNLVLLAPGANQAKIESVPTEDAEQPGMGKAIGGVVGGAVGLAAGAVAATVFLPGVGPIIALGLGAGGLMAASGAAGGDVFEKMLTRGLPKDEIYLYEDALKRGRSVLIARSADADLIRSGRDIMDGSGAETLDAAREQWWIGLRDAEAEEYEAPADGFLHVEALYRRGFEAAHAWELRKMEPESARAALRERFGAAADEEAFQRGYERGRLHAARERGKPAG